MTLGCERFCTPGVEECWVVMWRKHSVNYLFAPQRHVVLSRCICNHGARWRCDGELPGLRCYCFIPGGNDTVTHGRGGLVGSKSGLGVLGKTEMCFYRDSNQDSAAVERPIPTTLSRLTRKHSVRIISVMHFLYIGVMGSVTWALPWGGFDAACISDCTSSNGRITSQ